MTAPSTLNRSMTLLEWTLLVILSLLWGGSFFFVGVAVKELPPLTIVALRVGIAALALHAVIRAIGVPLPATRRAWSAFFRMGLLNNALPFALIVWAQTHIASGVASILNATTPLFTAIVAHAATHDETLTAARLFGVITGFAGVAVMIGGAALRALDDGVVAQCAVLAAALSYALAVVFGRRFRAMGIAPLAAATGQVTASSILLIPIALLADSPWTLHSPSADATGAVAGLALLSTALAYVVYFRVLASAGALNLLLVTFLIPVSAILLGVLVLGEALQARHLAGMALIGVGLLAADGRLWRALCGMPARGPAPARPTRAE
jgi:drug/metabolite transporter (DMT)-like permease